MITALRELTTLTLTVPLCTEAKLPIEIILCSTALSRLTSRTFLPCRDSDLSAPRAGDGEECEALRLHPCERESRTSL